jgi:hypothetical protein
LLENEPNKIYSERAITNKEIGPIPAFQFNPFRNGNCFKMGYALQSLWSGRGSLGALHGLAISNAIASLVLHKK